MGGTLSWLRSSGLLADRIQVILSHRHRFIFLKTRKTAGTSVEIALSRFCGPEDVITPILEEDEAVRRELGLPGPRNLEIPERFLARADRVLARVRRQPVQFFNHAPAAWIARHVDPDVWRSYFKFCFERNPFDRTISRYYWKTRGRSEPPPISDFLGRKERRRLSNWPVYTIGDEIAVDFVGRYESLSEDLAEALRRIGLPGDLELPRTKARFRRDRRPYREVLDEHTRRVVERLCAHELAAFGYRW